jgi:hypothetical protein
VVPDPMRIAGPPVELREWVGSRTRRLGTILAPMGVVGRTTQCLLYSELGASPEDEEQAAPYGLGGGGL